MNTDHPVVYKAFLDQFGCQSQEDMDKLLENTTMHPDNIAFIRSYNDKLCEGKKDGKETQPGNS